MPPAPRGARISYGPRRLPIERGNLSPRELVTPASTKRRGPYSEESAYVAPRSFALQGEGLLDPSWLDSCLRVRYNSSPLNFLRRHSQVVRRGSAKPLFPGSNPGAASNLSSATDAQTRSPGLRTRETGALETLSAPAGRGSLRSDSRR